MSSISDLVWSFSLQYFLLTDCGLPASRSADFVMAQSSPIGYIICLLSPHWSNLDRTGWWRTLSSSLNETNILYFLLNKLWIRMSVRNKDFCSRKNERLENVICFWVQILKSIKRKICTFSQSYESCTILPQSLDQSADKYHIEKKQRKRESWRKGF